MNKKTVLLSVLVFGYVAYRSISIENREQLCRVSCEEKGIYEYVFQPEFKGGAHLGSIPEICRCVTPEEVKRQQEEFEGMRKMSRCVAYLEEKYGDRKEVLNNISECAE